MKTLPFSPFLNASATASANGAAVSASMFQMVSGQAILAGQSSGTASIKLQFSDDVPGDTTLEPSFTPTNWSDIDNTSQTITTNGVVAIQKTEICARYVRAVYTSSAIDAGTITVNLLFLGWI